MRELKTWDERSEWLANRRRIGFIGSKDTMSMQNDIWQMELYRKHDGGYSIFITLDSDESWIVCDFDDVLETMRPLCQDCKSKLFCLSLIDTGRMAKCLQWQYLVDHADELSGR